MPPELWAWWEEQDAPTSADLFPMEEGNGCLPLAAILLFIGFVFSVWRLIR